MKREENCYDCNMVGTKACESCIPKEDEIIDTEIELRERMAELAHVVWQRWMAYMLPNLDEAHIKRWERQTKTMYADLPESERASDLSIADEYLAIVKLMGYSLSQK